MWQRERGQEVIATRRLAGGMNGWRGSWTYGDLGVRLQWVGGKLCGAFMGGRDGDGVLRAHAQGELLA